MKRMYAWMLAAVLICGANVFILYTDKDDDSAPTQPSQGENKTVSELKEEIDHFESEYQRDQSEIHQLQSNPKAMERIARERYFMKYADEEIFVLNDEEDASENTSHETAK